MTEKIYNALWEFTKQHRTYRDPDPNIPQPVAILYLYQEEAITPLPLKTAMDVEEACYCIKMALQHAF